ETAAPLIFALIREATRCPTARGRDPAGSTHPPLRPAGRPGRARPAVRAVGGRGSAGRGGGAVRGPGGGGGGRGGVGLRAAGGELVGVAAGALFTGTGWVGGVAVVPGHRRAGLGGAL